MSLSFMRKTDNGIIGHYNVTFISGLDDEEDFSCPPALETIEVQQQQVLIRILHFDINCLTKRYVTKLKRAMLTL